MKSSIFCFFLLLVLPIQAQNWQAMDFGFKPISDGKISNIIINPQSNSILVSGIFLQDGHGNSVQGVSEWDQTLSQWSSTYSSGTYIVFNSGFFQGQLHTMGAMTPISIQESGVFHVWDGSQWVFSPLGPEATVFGSRVIDGQLYLVGSFDLVGEQPTFGITIY